MLSLKLVRSLVFGDTINIKPFLSNQNHHHNDAHDEEDHIDVHDNDLDAHDINHHVNHTRPSSRTRTKTTPILIFLPTNELITNTYRICSLARDLGMNLHPNPSLSHIIFSWPSSSSSSSSTSSTATTTSWSSTSSSTWSLSENFVPLPFPSLTYASITHLQSFVALSKGLFKLAFCKIKKSQNSIENTNHWNCSSLSLFSRVGNDRIDSMESFFRVLAGMGWTMFKTTSTPSLVSGNFGSTNPISLYLFRKVDPSRGEFVDLEEKGRFRIRELRLPTLDFRNAPLRILQYILLMTDNIFYLA